MKKTLVGIIMGSDSDLSVMSEAAKVLEQFSVPFEITIVSAHRTPGRMYRYAEEGRDRGIEVIIAGAGGAAHLPGMVASVSPLPVIGVPVTTKSLNGLDSLLSIAQMPAGIPVATVAVNNAHNAGLLAVAILALKYPAVRKKLDKYRRELSGSVKEKAKLLEKSGYKKYLKQLSGNRKKNK